MHSAPIMEFRPASPRDVPAIRELVRAAYAKWVPVIGREPLPMAADYQLAVREHQIEILHVDGAMAGLIETMLNADHLWIENLAIRPSQQGKGLGPKLLARAEESAAAAGRRESRLQTNAAFAANVALYTKLGYAIDKREPFMGGITVFMSKRLGR
jgi:GNAT superfamily N-acetyltransferase